MPSEQYFVKNENEMYFITSTIVEWVNVFTRPFYKQIIVDSLKYCQVFQKPSQQCSKNTP